MKKLLRIFGIALALCLGVSCQDDHEMGDIVAPSNLEVDYTIQGVSAEFPDGDGTGFVDFHASADNAISYKYIFSDNTNENAPSGNFRKRFTRNGVNTYTVTVVASGTGGVSSSTTIEVTVFSVFSDEPAAQMLTGGSTKTWYWAAAEPGHLGVGPNDTSDSNHDPVWYSAAPFEKAGSPDSSCLYDNQLTFRMDGESIKFTLDNGGKTFFNAAFLGIVGGGGSTDLCMDYDVSGEKTVTLEPAQSLVSLDHSRGTQMTFSNGGFMGYYIGQMTYEILSITENRMEVRAVMGNDPALAWYHIFTTSPPNQGGGDDEDFTDLIWSDEFDSPGAPNSANWTYNTGTGENGWGNNESQFYTDRPDNVIVQDGVLKIIAKKETYSGSQYTSARLVTDNKFNFTYGKVEVRAKLPTGAGTWPAIWMLGQDYATNTWPGCGEIDIMEHVGNQQNIIHGTLHMPGNSGGSAITESTTVPGVSEDFHVYKLIWTANTIRFYVDDTLFHTFQNSPARPFNADFFLILNVAMGGNFGGTIDPGFVQSTMEVDYVRVYQ